jgi:lipopolysaccharide transport system permease protein
MVVPRIAPWPRAALGGFIWTLVRTDFKTRYQPTVGGFLWALAKPVAMFLVLVSVFSFLFKSDPTYRLNLIIGLFLWDFFAEGTKVGLLSLQSKAFLLTKARFPSWILIVASASNALTTLSVFCVVIVGFLAASGRPPALWSLGLFLWYLLHYVVIVNGFALGTSGLFVRYRDLNQIWEVVTQAGFFVAPIIFPLSILPERLHLYLYFWPPTPIIQFSRAVLVDGTMPTLKAHALLSLGTAMILVVGILIHHHFAPRVAEGM